MQLSSVQPQRALAARAVACVGTPPFLAATLTLGALLAVAAGVIAATRGFDGLYGQDAYAYFDYSTASVRNSILHLTALEPFFWPPGYPLLVGMTALLLGPIPLSGQVVSLLMGALVPIFTALLARELFPEHRSVGVLAGGMVAVCGQLWQSSVVVMADTTGLALATFGAWALARYARSHRVSWLVAAAAAIAYATLARWIYGLVGLPFGIYALWALLDGPHSSARRLAHAVEAVAIAALISVTTVGPSLIGVVNHPQEPAAFAGNFQVYSWSPLNALRHDFFTADGHLSYSLPNGVYYGVAPANLAFFGPLLAIWILPGLWAARAWPLRSAVVVVGWAAIVYVFHAGAPWQNFRFALAYLPPLAILAAAGVLLAWRRVGSDGRLQSAIAVSVGLGLLVSSVAAGRLVERFIDTKDNELSLVRWVRSQTPANAQLFSFGPTLAFRHYSRLTTYDLFDLSASDVAARASRPEPEYVLVDGTSLDTQWLNQAPWRNFELLRTGRGLSEVGVWEGYTLYQVNASAP